MKNMYELELRNIVSEPLEQFAHRAMRRMAEAMPYDSNFKAKIEKLKSEKIHAELNVRFRSGHFRGIGESHDFREALEKAESQVKQEIRHWRKNRFTDTSVNRSGRSS